MAEEGELIERCLEGEADAWDTLFDRHYAAAGAFIGQLSPSLTAVDVEEIAQETFLSVIRNLGTFKANSAFRTWLFRIAANKTRDFLDKLNAAKRGGGEIPASLDAPHPVTGASMEIPATTLPPDFALMNQERAFLVRECLDSLGDPCRDIIELRYFGDLSYEEIAQVANLNAKTVSSRLSRCLDALQQITIARLKRENSTSHSV